MTVQILQFGTTGQLATELLRQAPAHEVKVTALGRDTADLADPAAVAAKVRELSPEVVAIAAAAADVGAAVINVSTDYVFDGEGGAPYAENAPTNPLNAYGRTKLEGERAVVAANPRSLNIRTSWVVSAHGKNFVKTMLRVAAAGNPLKVVDDQSGRPTSAADLADFILTIAPRLAAAKAGDPVFGTVHFANSGEVTWRDFAIEIFAQALGDQAPEVGAQRTADYVTPARRPLRATMDLGKLEQVYGVTPRHWRDALSDIVAELGATSTP